MTSARKSFYLLFFALFTPCHSTTAKKSWSQNDSRVNTCAVDPSAIVSDACASYATLDTLNEELVPILQGITQSTDFFAYYRLNLFDQKCPVKAWDDESGTCGNIACKVDTLQDERDIPQLWRAEELSKLEGPKAAHPGKQEQRERSEQRPLLGNLGENVGESCVVEYDDECDERDYCIQEDERATSKGDYVSLVDNPERFTGYAGEPVWEAIYRENCFSKASSSSSNHGTSDSSSAQAANDLRFIFQAKVPTPEHVMDDECLEKRVFHRIISGMHASISTHICFDYLNQTTGTWGPNLACFREKIVPFPERISNLYFDYAILLRAVAKLEPSLQRYTYCVGDRDENTATNVKVAALLDIATKPPPIFDERTMFQDPEVSTTLKEDFRSRFRNVSRLMDCVGCDKCRLWGKLQTVGFGTALKILFEYDESNVTHEPYLKRTELVALINTLDRMSHSLASFRKMMEMSQMEEEEKAQEARQHLPLQKPVNKYLDHPNAKPAIVQAGSVGTGDKRAGHSSDKEKRLEDVLASDTQGGNDEGDEDEDETAQFLMPQDTLSKMIADEVSLIFNVWLHVLKSWVFMPAKIFRIVIIESSRLWSYWLGLEVSERSWNWEFIIPSRNEL